MKPNFELLRKLYARIAAKPESLVQLDTWRGEPNECGTPYCVLGELCCMPEAVEIGFGWNGGSPAFEGRTYMHHIMYTLGIPVHYWTELFGSRILPCISEKREALRRLEQFFQRYDEPLIIAQVAEEVQPETCS